MRTQLTAPIRRSLHVTPPRLRAGKPVRHTDQAPVRGHLAISEVFDGGRREKDDDLAQAWICVMRDLVEQQRADRKQGSEADVHDEECQREVRVDEPGNQAAAEIEPAKRFDNRIQTLVEEGEGERDPAGATTVP